MDMFAERGRVAERAGSDVVPSVFRNMSNS